MVPPRAARAVRYALQPAAHGCGDLVKAPAVVFDREHQDLAVVAKGHVDRRCLRVFGNVLQRLHDGEAHSRFDVLRVPAYRRRLDRDRNSRLPLSSGACCKKCRRSIGQGPARHRALRWDARPAPPQVFQARPPPLHARSRQHQVQRGSTRTLRCLAGGPQHRDDRYGANAGPGWQSWRLDSDDYRFPLCPTER